MISDAFLQVKEPDLSSSDIKQVVGGGAHTLVLKRSGELLSCGLGDVGQLGQGKPQATILKT